MPNPTFKLQVALLFALLRLEQHDLVLESQGFVLAIFWAIRSRASELDQDHAHLRPLCEAILGLTLEIKHRQTANKSGEHKREYELTLCRNSPVHTGANSSLPSPSRHETNFPDAGS